MAVGEAHVPHAARPPAPAHHHEPSKLVAPLVPVGAGAAGGAGGLAVPAPALSRSQTVVTSLLAGAAAGALAKTVIAPLDRTKINFQTSQTPYSWRAAVQFLAHSARAEGVLALWRGNSATMARIIPYAAIQFTAHEQWKRILGVDTPHTAQARPVVHLIAGSLAGVTSQSATYPLDLARARMAVTDAAQYRTLRAVFVKVAREEGLLTLYRGYVATVLGVIPYAGVSFFTYDSLKHKYMDYMGVAPSGLTNVAFGGAAGALGQTASYPLDIVRRRMQCARRLPSGEYQYRSVSHSLVTVYRAEGWRGFFKGLSMNWVKGPLAVGISFASYDAIRKALRDAALRLDARV